MQRTRGIKSTTQLFSQYNPVSLLWRKPVLPLPQRMQGSLLVLSSDSRRHGTITNTVTHHAPGSGSLSLALPLSKPFTHFCWQHDGTRTCTFGIISIMVRFKWTFLRSCSWAFIQSPTWILTAWWIQMSSQYWNFWFFGFWVSMTDFSYIFHLQNERERLNPQQHRVMDSVLFGERNVIAHNWFSSVSQLFH